MVLKDVRQIISELARIKKSIPPTEDVGRYLPDVRVNVRGEGERCGIKKALRLIEQAPTIDAVPVVHGRWGYRAYRTDARITVTGEVVCSHCHASFFRVAVSWFNYCPRCGADMREVAEG